MSICLIKCTNLGTFWIVLYTEVEAPSVENEVKYFLIADEKKRANKHPLDYWDSAVIKQYRTDELTLHIDLSWRI